MYKINIFLIFINNHKETNVLQQILDKQGTSKFVSTYLRISIVFRPTKQNVKGQELVWNIARVFSHFSFKLLSRPSNGVNFKYFLRNIQLAALYNLLHYKHFRHNEWHLQISYLHCQHILEYQRIYAYKSIHFSWQ